VRHVERLFSDAAEVAGRLGAERGRNVERTMGKCTAECKGSGRSHVAVRIAKRVVVVTSMEWFGESMCIFMFVVA